MAAGAPPGPVTLCLPTHARQKGSGAEWYGSVLQELQHVQHCLGSSAQSSGGPAAAKSAGFPQTAPLEDAAAAEALLLAQQLDQELRVLWRLDDSILRTAEVTDLLDAPPVLAPGPRVSGPASAAVRLKQLRAAFVSRSQQVNMAHNSYKCLSKHNDLYKTYVRVSTDTGEGVQAGSPTSTATVAVFSGSTSASEDPGATSSSGAANASRASSFTGSGSEFTGPSIVTSSPFVRTSYRASARASGGGGARSPPPVAERQGDLDGDCVLDSLSFSRGDGSGSPGGSPCSISSGGLTPIRDVEPAVQAQPQKRVRSGLFGLAGFFSRGRSNAAPEDVPRSPAAKQQAPPAEPNPEPIRRSLSEPAPLMAWAARRQAVDFGHATVPASVTSAAVEEGGRLSGTFRRSRDAERGTGGTVRSRSEPAAVGRGGARDAHRRRGFMMDEVDEGSEQDDHFITPDLAVRSALFNSEPGHGM
mmetsp:Transcript_19469/g.58834  ORF Transcript_19469/g.58834 Transcript_19469/m.58834 type:complete len:473 (+) Transcript_19469:342-1760(+)